MPNKKGKTISADAEDVRCRPFSHKRQKHNSIKKADIIELDSLYESMHKCFKNVSWKSSVTSFRLNWLEKLGKLADDLESGNYKARPTGLVIVKYPKYRECLCVTFRDRVYQRSLNDNALYPLVTNSFIYDNAACQFQKGTDFARKRIKEFMRRLYRKHGNNGYVLHIDIKSYYPSMKHELAKNVFAKFVPKTISKMANSVLDNQYAGDIGYNPGSQMVQIAGIAVLSELDHYIKEQLHIQYYLRYMDDFILIHHDKEVLKDCLRIISGKLADMGFRIHDNKTNIMTLKQGFLFLGFTFRLTNSGKALMLISGENVKHEKKKLKKMVEKAKNGEITRAKVSECYRAWKAHASAGDTFLLLQRMDQYYKELWR